MTDACITVLQVLGDGLLEQGYLPGPVFWDGPFCTGNQSPTLENWYSPEPYSRGEATTTSNMMLDTVRTIYIPSHMSVTFSDGSHEVNRVDITGSDISETLILDTKVQNRNLEDTSHYTFRPTFGTAGLDDSPNAIMDMCRGQDVYFGSKLFESYRPQSAQCDGIYEEWCDSSDVRRENADCNCFRDRRDLRAKYPGINMPVRCMGPNCAITGYRTQEMDDQKCNQLVCQATIELVGEDLVNDTDTRVFCGQSFYEKKNGEIIKSADHFVEHPAQPGHFIYVGNTDAVQRSSERYVLEDFMPAYVLAIVLVVLFTLAIGVGLWFRSNK